MVRRIPLLVVATILAAAVRDPSSVAFAKDYFLTIGGGYNPTGNQVSLEKNVVFMQSVLKEKRPDHPPHDIYFADGDNAERDVHYRDPDFEKSCPPARRMMAELFGDADGMDYVYRNHEIEGVTGPAEKDVLERRFRELSRELKGGDRLIVYATGHGGPATPARGRGRRGGPRGVSNRGRGGPTNPYNTTLYTWDNGRITASEFATWLGDFRPDVNVVLIMVQCHAGGFAQDIFDNATAANGLAPHQRCGFFSQVYDRAAAGCTPDVDEADYQEYSSFFWAALAGRTRAGAKLANVDYDHNGEVSFAEAHAYAVLASDTIDIPVRTTEALLRTYSWAEGVTTAASPPTTQEAAGPRRGGRGILPILGEARAERRQENNIEEATADLMPFAGSLSKLAELARPEQRAILEQLPLRLGLTGAATIADVQRRLDRAKSDIAAAGDRANEASAQNTNALNKVRDEIRHIWPELNSDLSPTAVSLASERADEFTSRVERMASFRSFETARAADKKASDAQLDAERMEAKVQRLLRTCEDIVLAANLSKVAAPDIVTRYEKLVKLEEGTLGGAQ